MEEGVLGCVVWGPPARSGWGVVGGDGRGGDGGGDADGDGDDDGDGDVMMMTTMLRTKGE